MKSYLQICESCCKAHTYQALSLITISLLYIIVLNSMGWVYQKQFNGLVFLGIISILGSYCSGACRHNAVYCSCGSK